MRRTQFATIAAGSLLLALTACGEDEPDPIPSTSSTPTPTVSVSPAPSAPTLNAEQKDAYEAALKVQDQYRSLLIRMSQNPEAVGKSDFADALRLATEKEVRSLGEAHDELMVNEARVEGERKIAWTVASEVTSKTVVVQQCETPGTWTLVGKGKEAPQTSNTVTQSRLALISGRWYVTETRSDGTC